MSITHDDTTALPVVIDVPQLTVSAPGRLPAPLRRTIDVLRSNPDVGLWLGVALVATGFISIAVAWHDMARLEQVPLQLPYLASGAAVGLGLVLCGITSIALSARAKDTAQRKEQLAQLAATLQAVEQGVREQRATVEAALAALTAPKPARRSR